MLRLLPRIILTTGLVVLTAKNNARGAEPVEVYSWGQQPTSAATE